MFFSSTTPKPGNPCVQRTLGIARTRDLDGVWTPDAQPLVPIEEQVENSSLYYEPASQTWFLFTNHIGLDGGEFTDAVWVYWTRDLNQWNPKDKAIGQGCLKLATKPALGREAPPRRPGLGGNGRSGVRPPPALRRLSLTRSVHGTYCSRNNPGPFVMNRYCEFVPPAVVNNPPSQFPHAPPRPGLN